MEALIAAAMDPLVWSSLITLTILEIILGLHCRDVRQEIAPKICLGLKPANPGDAGIGRCQSEQ